MISPSTRIDGRAFEKRYSASAPRADAVRSRRSRPPVRGGSGRGGGSRRTPVRESGSTTAGSGVAASTAESSVAGSLACRSRGRRVASPAAFDSDLPAGVPRFRRSSIHTSSPPRAATTVNRSPGAAVEGWSSLSTAPYSASACSASAGRSSDRSPTIPSSVIGACGDLAGAAHRHDHRPLADVQHQRLAVFTNDGGERGTLRGAHTTPRNISAEGVQHR